MPCCKVKSTAPGGRVNFSRAMQKRSEAKSEAKAKRCESEAMRSYAKAKRSEKRSLRAAKRVTKRVRSPDLRAYMAVSGASCALSWEKGPPEDPQDPQGPPRTPMPCNRNPGEPSRLPYAIRFGRHLGMQQGSDRRLQPSSLSIMYWDHKLGFTSSSPRAQAT